MPIVGFFEHLCVAKRSLNDYYPSSPKRQRGTSRRVAQTPL